MPDTTHENPKRRPTRNDVARLAGVSTAVVSYVFNNGPKRVSDKSTKAVLEAAAKLHYRPNSTARTLRTGRSRTFGVMVPDFSNPYSAGLYDAIEAEASAHGYVLIFMSTHSNPEIERKNILTLGMHNVDALFLSTNLSSETLSMLHNEDYTFVVMDYTAPIPGCKTVSTDLYNSAYQAVTHLIHHGHSHVDMLHGGSPDDLSDPRIRGWLKAHHDAGITAGEIRRSYYTREGGYTAACDLLDSQRPPSALFVSSDLEALGALRAIHDHHLRIPEDIAIVSFDGTVDSRYTEPKLTTMQQNFSELAAKAVAAALHPESVPDTQLVDATLVIRDSCGC